MRQVSDNLSLLSKMGRGGDTELRHVDGELSHVNPTEAAAIDMYGSIGENVVKAVGSGTINPNTGLKEYSIVADVFAGLTFLTGLATSGAQRGLEMDLAEDQADLYQDLIDKSEEKESTFATAQTAETNIAKMLTGSQYEKLGSQGDIAAGNITKSLDKMMSSTRGIEDVGKIKALGEESEQRLFSGMRTGYEDIGSKFIATEFNISEKYKDLTAQEQARRDELGYKKRIEERKSQGIFMGEKRGFDSPGLEKGWLSGKEHWGNREGWG